MLTTLAFRTHRLKSNSGVTEPTACPAKHVKMGEFPLDVIQAQMVNSPIAGSGATKSLASRDEIQSRSCLGLSSRICMKGSHTKSWALGSISGQEMHRRGIQVKEEDGAIYNENMIRAE